MLTFVLNEATWQTSAPRSQGKNQSFYGIKYNKWPFCVGIRSPPHMIKEATIYTKTGQN